MEGDDIYANLGKIRGMDRAKPLLMPKIAQSYDSDPLEEEEPMISFGADTQEEMKEAREEAVKRAVEEGLDGPHVQHLRELLEEFSDCFCIKLNGKEPSKLTPMRIKLKENAVPIICSPRRYTPDQTKYMTNILREACGELLGSKGLLELLNKPAPVGEKSSAGFLEIHCRLASCELGDGQG